jgi:hypothetical protein
VSRTCCPSQRVAVSRDTELAGWALSGLLACQVAARPFGG